MALAAISHEEVKQGAGAGIIGRIANLPVPPLGLDEPGALQFLEVERQRRRGHPKTLGDLARGHAVRPLADQQAEHLEPRFLRKGGQAGEGLLRFHDLIIIEMKAPGKVRAPAKAARGGTMKTDDDLRALVRERYGAIVREAACCGLNVVGSAYAGVEGRLAEADLNLGCGVPTRHAALRPGETVLDLGSGAGNDVFIARHEVGADGRAIGVDMTPDMVARARANARKLGYGNVEFRLGEIEHLPVETGSVDVIISNCVLNLLPEKAPAFAEMFRVLRPGGRFCVSDIVATGELPAPVREAAGLYVGCIAGALPEATYLALIGAAGFQETRVAQERPIELPDEALSPHMGADEIAAFRASGVQLKSVTVLASRPR
jgi:arsenite methyltransferase